jgi:hypothetical protein
MKIRASAPAGSASISAPASPARRRILSSRSSSMPASALATPLMNGSQPMKPTSRCALACASRCSPPPKPISSQSSLGEKGNSLNAPSPSDAASISNRGRRSAIRLA